MNVISVCKKKQQIFQPQLNSIMSSSQLDENLKKSIWKNEKLSSPRSGLCQK